LQKPMPLKDDPFHVGADDNKVSDWVEMILPDTAKPLAFYDHPFFGKYPAITRNTFGKGSLTYEGTVLTETLQKAVLLEVLQSAGLMGSDQKLPPAIHVKHAQNRQGKTVHFYFNYSSSPQMVPYAYTLGTDLLSQAPAGNGQSLLLQPWDAAIIEEK